MLHVFADGACRANGQRGARAGQGVVLWNFPESPTLPIQISKPLQRTEMQTNQRAELRALERAFQEIEQRGIKAPVTIWTDSEQARKCVIEWGPQWKVRGWKRKAGGKPLEHMDILPSMINWFEASQHFVRIQHIRAHTNKTEFPQNGNALADTLATSSLNDAQPQHQPNPFNSLI